MENNQFRIAILSLWWGAFTFYSAIVVPMGMKVLGSHPQMGMITQEVTVYLNIFSFILFIIYAYSLRYESDKTGGLVKQIMAITVVACQILLFLIHAYLSDLINVENQKVFNSSNFYFLHRLYLIIETIIWVIISVTIFKILNLREL